MYEFPAPFMQHPPTQSPVGYGYPPARTPPSYPDTDNSVQAQPSPYGQNNIHSYHDPLRHSTLQDVSVSLSSSPQDVRYSYSHVRPHAHYDTASRSVKQEIKQEDEPMDWSVRDMSSESQHRLHGPHDYMHTTYDTTASGQSGDAYHGEEVYVKAESPYADYGTRAYSDDDVKDPISPQEGLHQEYACYDQQYQYDDQVEVVRYEDGHYVSYNQNEMMYGPAYASASPDYAVDDYSAAPESPIAGSSMEHLHQQPYDPSVYQHNRSYTLEAAMTPVTPTRQSAPELCQSTPEPAQPRPIMGHLPLPEEAITEPAEVQPARRPRGRPRKHPLPVRSSPPPPVNYPYPQFPSPDEVQGPSSTQPRKLMDSLQPPPPPPPYVHMSLDEVPMPDSEDRPGQAIFKLNTAGEPKEPPKKKPIMACLFCRERKIACGPPAPDGTEKRCNQCARRKLVCEYPKESRRGQHKRGPRAARVKALADATVTDSTYAETGVLMTTGPIMAAAARPSSSGSGGQTSSRPKLGKIREHKMTQ